jgi:hypothetical protein
MGSSFKKLSSSMIKNASSTGFWLNKKLILKEKTTEKFLQKVEL